MVLEDGSLLCAAARHATTRTAAAHLATPRTDTPRTASATQRRTRAAATLPY